MKRYLARHTFDVQIDEKVPKELEELGLEQHFEALLEDLCHYAHVEDIPTNMYLVKDGEDYWWDDGGASESLVVYVVRGIDQFDVVDQGFEFKDVRRFD